MSKFGFYTDVHLTNKNIRIDNFSETAINKLRECYSFAKKNNFDFMICGGDVFNTEKIMDLKIFLGLLEIMSDFGKPTYFIIGNHDIYGNSLNTYKDCSLNFISSLIPNLLIPIFDKIELDDIILYGCNTFNNIHYCLDHIEKNSEKLQVLIDHHMLYDKKIPGADVIFIKDLKKNNADLVLSGHVHMGYKIQKEKDTTYFNPGSLLRTSCDLKNLKVKMGIIESVGKKFEIDLFFPTIVEGDLIFKENIFSGIEKLSKMQLNESSSNSAESLKHFLELKDSSINVFDLLSKIAKENNIDPNIMKFIYKFNKTGKLE